MPEHARSLLPPSRTGLAAFVVLAMTALIGCGGSGGTPTAPTSAPASAEQLLATVTGAYSLEVTPSSVCTPPPVPLRWEVQATQGQDRVRLTLVGGDASVDLSLYPGLQAGAIDGSLQTSVWVGDWDVVIFGQLGGAINRGAGGRAEIRDGNLDARIWIDDYENPMYSCTAANHRWSLTPR